MNEITARRCVGYLAWNRNNPRSWAISLLIAAVIACLVLILAFPPVSKNFSMPLRKHGTDSITSAVGGAFCGNPYARQVDASHRETAIDWLGNTVKDTSLSFYLQNRPELRDIPIRSALEQYYNGDIQAFCKTLTLNLQIHDPGVSILMRTALEVAPDISMNQLGYILFGFRVSLILAGVLLLVRNGISPAAVVMMAWVCMMMEKIHQEVYFFSIYPYIPAAVFFFVCFCTHHVCKKSLSNLFAAVTFALAAGVMIGVLGELQKYKSSIDTSKIMPRVAWNKSAA